MSRALIVSLACLLISHVSFAATGDITSVEISPSGAEPYGACADITIDGFTTGKTIDFGSGRGSQLSYADIASAKIVFTVVSQGYDSTGTLGTTTRTVYATSIVRKPYPNQTDNQEPSATVIRVALSEFIYLDDNTGTGKSGTAPTVTIAAGAIRNDGGASQTNAAATNLTCTNSSALDYPDVIARWDRVAGVCTADRVTGAFTMAARAYHRFGIAGVRFDATGETSSVNVNSTATTRTATQRSGSGLWAEAYHSASTAISGMTDDELIDLRFRAYPSVGDADNVVDTNNYTTAADECLGRNKSIVLCDKDVDGNIYGVVSSSGNDTTGATSTTLATAEGTPYLTIEEAIKDGATIVYLLDGTFDFPTLSTRRTTNEWVVVRHHPTSSSEAGAIVLFNGILQAYKVQRLMLQDVTVRVAGTTSGPWGENLNYLRINSCDWDKNSIGAGTVSLGEENLCTYIDNCVGDLGEDTFRKSLQSSDRIAFCFDGTDFGTPASAATFPSPAFEVCASKVRGAGLILGNLSSPNPAPDRNNFLFDFNEFKNIGSTDVMVLGDDAAISGVAIVGNVIESTATVSTPITEIAATATNTTATNVLLWHNSLIGERENLAYDGTTTGAPHRHTNWSVKYNVFEDTHTKADVFYTNASLIGSWPVVYKVGFLENHDIDFTSNTSGGQDWLVNGFGLTTGDPVMVDDASSGDYGDDSGNGDYTPDAGSPLLGRLPSGLRIVTIDMYGNGVIDGGDIGAIQVSTECTSGSTGWVLLQTASQTTTADADWASTGNALVDDANATTSSVPDSGYSETLKLTNPAYGTSIPTGATYTVSFRIKHKGTGGGGRRALDSVVQFIDDTGTQVGDNVAMTTNYWPSTTASEDYVATGLTLDGTEFTSAAGVAIKVSGVDQTGAETASIYAVWIKVDWTCPSALDTTRGFFMLGGG